MKINYKFYLSEHCNTTQEFMEKAEKLNLANTPVLKDEYGPFLLETVVTNHWINGLIKVSKRLGLDKFNKLKIIISRFPDEPNSVYLDLGK